MTIGEIIAARTGERTDTILRVVLTTVPTSRESIATIVDEWCARKAADANETHLPVLRGDAPPYASKRFSFSTVEDDGAIALRLEHVDFDPSRARRAWLTDVALVPAESGTFHLDVALSVRLPLDAPDSPRTVPAFVRMIGTRVGFTDGGWPMRDALPVAFSRDRMPALCAFIENPARQLPVVLLTPPFALDATALARQLFGVAHVILIEDRATWDLANLLGEEWRVFGGAVRTYAPYFERSDAQNIHPRWLRDTIDQIIQRSAAGRSPAFPTILARHLFATTTAAAGHLPVTNVDALDLRRYARERATAAPTIVSEAPSPPAATVEQHAADASPSEPESPAPAPPEANAPPTVATSTAAAHDFTALLQSQAALIESLTAERNAATTRADTLEAMYLEIETKYVEVLERSGGGSEDLARLREIGQTVPGANALLDAFEALVRGMTPLLEQSRAAIAAAATNEDELRNAQSKIAWLTSRLEVSADADEAADEPLPDYDDSNAFAAWIAARYDGRILIHPRALATWEDGQYEDRDRLRAALDLLGNEYHAMRTREENDTRTYDRYVGKRGALGLRDGPPITISERGRYREVYEVKWAGETRTIDLHLRNNGNAADPRGALAIYFFWDDDAKASVLCALPGHLQNRLSP